MDLNINPNECVSNIVNTLKSNGSFDQFRRECLSDVDTKPSYRNLIQRVDICVNKFFSKQDWNPSLNKAQLRNRLRNEINDADQVRNGIHHLVDQIVNTKIRFEFKEKIEKSLKDYLGETLDSNTESTSNVVEEEAEKKEPDEISDVTPVHSSDLSDFDDEISISSNDDDHKDSKKKITSLKVVEEETEKKEPDDEISDVSSVHTSDLSDFDDEISISSDDDDHKDSKKKKISLKVVKELTASISEEKKSIEVDDSSEQALSNKSTASSDSDDDQKEQLKRKRKKNPKFESNEPVKKLKRIKNSMKESVPEESGKGEKEMVKEGASLSTRQSLKRKQAETPAAKNDAKISNLRTRQASLSSEFSAMVEKPSTEKRGRGRPRKAMPVDQNSNKRYDSSDLYKPRNSLANTSSRRTRSAVDVDSNSNSLAEDL